MLLGESYIGSPPQTHSWTHFTSQNPPQSPQIRVATRLVQIGVIVHDKNGPVADLRKEDFTVLDRGKPQTISIFSTDAALAAQQPRERTLPPNTFSDLPHYGAVVPHPKGYFAFPDTTATKNENTTRLVTEVESPIESSLFHCRPP